MLYILYVLDTGETSSETEEEEIDEEQEGVGNTFYLIIEFNQGLIKSKFLLTYMLTDSLIITIHSKLI